jgi:hypothetical protein
MESPQRKYPQCRRMEWASSEVSLGLGWTIGVADNKGSHGRDNKIRMYEPLRLSGRLGQGVDKNKGLEVVGELDVNSLNFCRFSIASAPSSGKGKGKEAEGVLVVPSLLDSEYVSPPIHGQYYADV